jgi:8-oxo-dGTP pyrophosphatase MutT (NUDIX family)
MAHHYTDEERRAFYATQSRKRMGVMTVFTNQADEILIVKPNYKDGWNLVGGFIDENEAPLAAARRETKEEIGLDLPADRFSLLGVHYLPPRLNDDFLRILFKAALTPEEISTITIQPSELENYKFVKLDALKNDSPRIATGAAYSLLSEKPHNGYTEAPQQKEES